MALAVGVPRAAALATNDAGLLLAYSCIRKECLLRGLSRCDADDTAQDVFLWLLRNRLQLGDLAMPWLRAVTKNFILRQARAQKVRSMRESEAAEGFDSSEDATRATEIRLSLDRIERRLPDVEARLLRLVRQGNTFVEAVARLGIPRGSRSFLRKRLVALLAERLRFSDKAL